MSVEYIGKNNEGIPEEVFSDAFGNGRVDGLSGKSQYKYDITPTSITIGFHEVNPFGFSATCTNGVLNIIVNTRASRNGYVDKIPDLFAAELIKRSIKFFEDNGTQVSQWHSSWYAPKNNKDVLLTDNARQFINYLKLNRLAHNDESFKRAASITWTGVLAKELGFTVHHVEVTYITKRFLGLGLREIELVKVDFKR